MVNGHKSRKVPIFVLRQSHCVAHANLGREFLLYLQPLVLGLQRLTAMAYDKTKVKKIRILSLFKNVYTIGLITVRDFIILFIILVLGIEPTYDLLSYSP